MKKEENIIYHKVLLEKIEQFIKPKSGKLVSNNEAFNGKKAKFKQYQKEFRIEFPFDFFTNKNRNLEIGQNHKEIQIQFGDLIYNLENIFLGNQTLEKFTGSVNKIHTIGFSAKSKYFYRLIIPLDKKLDFHFQIEQINFKTDLGYRSRTGTIAIINNETVRLCCIYNEEKKHFLVIDSEVKQTFDEFAEKANAVKIGMGYLSGFFAGNQGFFFSYNSIEMKEPQHFRFVTLRDSIESAYSPVYSNAFGYIHNNKQLAEHYNLLLRPVSIKEFSLLCEKIYQSIDFSSTLMLILESSIASLLFMPGGFAIALETLSDLIIGNKKLKLAPIKDKAVSRKIRKEFLEILNNNNASILPEDLEILYKRIDQINQTTNKARLKAPFDILSITIYDSDMVILETRNDFLHGRVPDLLKTGPKRSIDRINKDLYYCSMRFYTLLNIVILKWIGYNNRVVNYPKINEGYTQIILDEEPFRHV